jgi:hypothetical protein
LRAKCFALGALLSETAEESLAAVVVWPTEQKLAVTLITILLSLFILDAPFF